MSIASILKIQQCDAMLLLNIQYVKCFQTKHTSEDSYLRSTIMCSVLKGEYKNPRETVKSIYRTYLTQI